MFSTNLNSHLVFQDREASTVACNSSTKSEYISIYSVIQGMNFPSGHKVLEKSEGANEFIFYLVACLIWSFRGCAELKIRPDLKIIKMLKQFQQLYRLYTSY